MRYENCCCQSCNCAPCRFDDGGFNSGGSGCPIYDGEAMARKGIVFVSINYRVGNFGFFAHPELTRESGVHASGNYGLMDHRSAGQGDAPHQRADD